MVLYNYTHTAIQFLFNSLGCLDEPVKSKFTESRKNDKPFSFDFFIEMCGF